jgi:hypothetical protein
MKWPQMIRQVVFATMLAGALSFSQSVIGQVEKEPYTTEQKPEKSSDEKSMSQRIASKRLEFIKTSVGKYEMVAGQEEKSRLSLVPEPLLRFTNPVSGLQDGCFILWTSEASRPMVGAQVFLTNENLWIHEFQSLASEPISATLEGETVWSPDKAGATSKLVPDAPQPASTTVQRLIQMREIANRFNASDEFEGRVQSDELRLLTRPLFRFGKADTQTLDGALFAHAHGTDPELLIIVEAIRIESSYHWHYALAPMTGYALKANLDGQPEWEVPWRQPPYDPKEPFFIRVHSKQLTLRDMIPFKIPGR